MIIIYVYFSVKIVEFKVRFVNGWKGLETPSEISEILLFKSKLFCKIYIFDMKRK